MGKTIKKINLNTYNEYPSLIMIIKVTTVKCDIYWHTSKALPIHKLSRYTSAPGVVFPNIPTYISPLTTSIGMGAIHPSSKCNHWGEDIISSMSIIKM